MLLRKSLPVETNFWRGIVMQFSRHARATSLRRIAFVVIAVCIYSSVGIAQTAAPPNASSNSDIELHGSITPDKLGKHEMLAFDVPAGIERMNVELISPGFQKGMY